MNCNNQQFNGMYRWPGQTMPDTDCGMPPAMIPAPVVSPAMPRVNQAMPPFAPPVEMQREFPLGMAYVPMQRWSQPSPLAEGLRRGTLFCELDLPFMMGRCR